MDPALAAPGQLQGRALPAHPRPRVGVPAARSSNGQRVAATQPSSTATTTLDPHAAQGRPRQSPTRRCHQPRGMEQLDTLPQPTSLDENGEVAYEWRVKV